MTQLRIAVVGVGHLGQIHARLLQKQSGVELTAVVDPDDAARKHVAASLDTRGLADIAQLPSNIDAAIVATPTCWHATIGRQLLSRGIHVLMEKPLASTAAEAQDLVDLAKQNDCLLQVGHVERFNPAVQSVAPLIADPKYIEARRLSPYTFRSTDIGVVLDLMIHDLDLILQMVHSEVIQIQALGTSVLGGHEDLAQARLEFRNGCVANLTASRTSLRPERTMSIYCPTLYAGIDFGQRTAELIRPRADLSSRRFDFRQLNQTERQHVQQHMFETLLPREVLTSGTCNPLADEQEDFIRCIQAGSQPQVSGQAGLSAVALAEQIRASLESHCWNGTAAGPIGPHAVPGPTILPLPDAASWRKAG